MYLNELVPEKPYYRTGQSKAVMYLIAVLVDK